MQSKKDDLIIRLDARHDDLLRRIADLERRTTAVLEQWTGTEETTDSENESVERPAQHTGLDTGST